MRSLTHASAGTLARVLNTTQQNISHHATTKSWPYRKARSVGKHKLYLLDAVEKTFGRTFEDTELVSAAETLLPDLIFKATPKPERRK
jgi:hypothetical protein